MKNRVMEKWEVEEVLEKLPPEEHQKFLKSVLTDLKKTKAKNDLAAVGKQSWKALGPIALIGVLGTSLAAAFSTGAGSPLDVLAGTGLLATLGSFMGFVFGGLVEDEQGIKACKETSEKAKEQIAYLNGKILETSVKMSPKKA